MTAAAIGNFSVASGDSAASGDPVASSDVVTATFEDECADGTPANVPLACSLDDPDCEACQ
jgi:hypothetical protein